MILPQIAIPTKSSTLSFSLPSKLDWKDDSTFVGMPGHNLDENYNPRPDLDFARDQP
jgi:hypothetical protein